MREEMLAALSQPCTVKDLSGLGKISLIYCTLNDLIQEGIVVETVHGVYALSGRKPRSGRKEGKGRETSNKVLTLIERRPGLTGREIARELNISYSAAAMHARILVRRGDVFVAPNTLPYRYIMPSAGVPRS